MREITKNDLANKDIIRENSKRGEEVVKIQISKVKVREGFNVRTDYGDIESLAKSIIENGQVVPARVDAMADGTFLLTDGHRRFKALQHILEQGSDEPLLKAIVNASRTTEEERILQMFVTQDNKPLTQLEVCELIKRLINLGHDQTSVAKKIGKSIAYVSTMLSVANERQEVKQLISEGKVSVNTVLTAKREIPSESERVEKFRKAVAQAESETPSGRIKISAEDITNKKSQKVDLVVQEIMAIWNGDTMYAPEESTIREIIQKHIK